MVSLGKSRAKARAFPSNEVGLPNPGSARQRARHEHPSCGGLGGAALVHLGANLCQSPRAPVLTLVEDLVALALAGALVVRVVGAFPEGVGDDRVLELVRDRTKRLHAR